jgi:KDO2-lipid IV(A) lauroyltransferase
LAQEKSWVRQRAEYGLAYALLASLRVPPRGLAEQIAAGAARVLDAAIPKLRRVARINLSFAFPQMSAEARERTIDGVFAGVGRLLVAFARFPLLTRENVGEWIEYEGLEHYLAAKREGRGVLVATAHLGNWELSAFTHALMTEPMNVMVRPLDNPLIDEVVERYRGLSGNRLIYKKEAARNVLRALKNNEAVGVLLDQNTSAAEGVFVDFFGKAACAGLGFVKLAYHAQAPVVPGYALWDSARQRYVLRFFPRIELTGDEQTDTQRIHSHLETVIREYPEQWLWIHRRWKTRPPDEPPLY